MATEDQILLRRFCTDGDNDAFSELIRRHLPLVYSVAMRQVADPGLAEDVVQMVFARLAQRARRLPGDILLAGWLHADTRLTALQLLRSNQRRRAREAEAFEMQQINSSLEKDWLKIGPVLDEILEELLPPDREVLLLCFFAGRSFSEVGTAFGLSESAARMRVVRALDKLRDFLLARGISTAREVLSIALSTYGAQAAPPSLAAIVAAKALAASPSITGTTIALFSMSNAKLVGIGVIVASGLIAPTLWQHRLNGKLWAQNQSLRSELDALRGSLDEAKKQKESLGHDLDRFSKQELELAQLRNTGQQARQQLDLLRGGDPPLPPSEPVLVSEADVAEFLQRSKVEQGDTLGHLRRQMMGQEKRSDDQFNRNRALAEAVRPTLEELESHPDQFAEFQTSFVKAAIGLQDEEKTARIRQIVERTYQQALAEKLGSDFHPKVEAEAWTLRRDALDRQATHAIQELLTNEERARFDSAFLGIMGIDLGLNDGSQHRFSAPDGTIVFPSEGQELTP